MQQKSAPLDGGDGGDLHYLALTTPESASASIFNDWFDVPILGGAGPSGQPHESMDLPGCYPPWQSATSMAGSLAHRAQGFDFGPTATPIMDQGFNPSIPTHTSTHQYQLNAGPRVPTSNHPLNTFGASLLFDPMGYTDPASITGLVQHGYISSAAGSNQRVVSPFGTEGVGGGNRISVHPLANHGGPTIVQSPRQAHRQTELDANMDPPEVSFRTGHDQLSDDGFRVSSTNNQTQSSAPGIASIVDVGLYLPAPAPSGDEVLNRGEHNGMPRWIALTKPLPQAEDHVITLRRETHVTLDISFEQISKQLSEVCSGFKIPATGSVKNYADTTGKFLLEFRINLYGATTKRHYKDVCANCEKREGKKKGILNPIDFKTESDMIVPKDGKIRIDFVFCCYPKDHRLGDGEYLVEVVLSKDADQNRIVARHRLPFSFNVVPKYCQAQARPPSTAGAKRSRRHIEESEERPLTLDRRNVRLRSEGPSQRAPGNERIDGTTPAINLRDPPLCGQHRGHSPPSSLSFTPPIQLPPNAGPNSDSLSTLHQVIVPPRVDQQPTPTLMDVNPESGSITGGARIWLKGRDFPAVFPLFARFGTAVVSTTFSSSTLLSCHLPPATLPGLVDVTLSKDHQPGASEYGTSIAKFQYLRDQDQLIPILLRIQGQAYPEFTPVLLALLTTLSGSQGNQILQGKCDGVQPRENPTETGLVRALSCIQARPEFREIVSSTNQYGQTLAHLAILYDYLSLLRHLVDWCIDLAISDVNGLTALHCAYMKGDLHSVRILRRGGAPETAKDKLGRIPSDLQPEGVARGFDIDVEMDTPGIDIDEQVVLGRRFSALPLDEDNDSGHGQSDFKDYASDAKEPAGRSNNLPAPAQSQPERPKYDHLLRLHDPYGPGLSFSEFGDLVRHSLMIAPEPPTPPQNQEARQAPTRKPPCSSRRKDGNWWEFILQLIRLICSWLQMRLPSMYFLRVASIIQISEISMADLASIQRRATRRGFLGMITLAGGVSTPDISEIHSIQRFEKNWEALVMRCIEEWKTFYITSAFLLGILLTFLQMHEAGLHPFTRLTALLSLECTVMSLLYCALYLPQFRSLRGVENGMSWVFAAAQTSTPPYWNMWLFLALPAVWFAWSLIFFSTSLLSFVWTSGDRRDPDLTPFTEDETMDFMPMTFRDFIPLWGQITLTVVFSFGLGMGLLVMKTFRALGANRWVRPKSSPYMTTVVPYSLHAKVCDPV